MLDEEVVDLNDIEAVKEEALQSSAHAQRRSRRAFLVGRALAALGEGQPNGGGNTVLTLTFSFRLVSVASVCKTIVPIAPRASD